MLRLSKSASTSRCLKHTVPDIGVVFTLYLLLLDPEWYQKYIGTIRYLPVEMVSSYKQVEWEPSRLGLQAIRISEVPTDTNLMYQSVSVTWLLKIQKRILEVIEMPISSLLLLLWRILLYKASIFLRESWWTLLHNL